MRKNINMTEKQIIDRLDSINLSLRQKKDLIDIIKDITANSGGGGTSTDKDALYIYVDFNHFNITFNNKTFTPDINDSSETNIVINNKELYNTLYNSLVNTNIIVHILSTTKPYMHLISTMITCANDEVTFLMIIGSVMMISVRNK